MLEPFPEEAVVRAGRVFVALRKSGRVSSSKTRVFHAVTPYCRMSLCAEPPGQQITCPACIRRLSRLQ